MKLHPTEIPSQIKPEDPQDGIELPVVVPELDTAMEQVEALAQKMGMEFIDKTLIARLRAAGVALSSLGMVKISRGGLFLTQQMLLHVNSQLVGDLDRSTDVQERRGLAETIAKLSEKTIRMSKEVREGADASEESGQQQGKYRSFQPQSVVQNNYYGNATKSPPNPARIVQPPEENPDAS